MTRAGLRRYALSLVGVLVSLAVIAIGPASASAEPPAYDGGMTFPAIQGPSGPEEYSWKVSLGEGQELEAIDERNAAVYYTEGHQLALGITAGLAHDAVGSTVPTSLGVSGGDIITLTVHHRAGNPAANAAPFMYPISAGAGWEGGFHTEIVAGPKDEQELREERERRAREEREAAEEAGALKGCLVPRLKSRSLKASRRRLDKAGCKLGDVTGKWSRTAKVVKQNPRPGQLLAAGAKVGIKLGDPPSVGG